MNPYALYMELVKSSNLMINPVRSRQLGDKLLKSRIAREGVQVLQNSPKAHAIADAGGGYATLVHEGKGGLKKQVFINPNNPVKSLSWTQEGQRDLHDLFTHHEVDEASLLPKMPTRPAEALNDLRAVQSMDRSKMKAMVQKNVDRPMYYTASLHGPAIPNGAGQAGISHASPEVILRESNRVAHQYAGRGAAGVIPSDIPQTMANVRTNMSFDGQLMSTGYGKKYIPEGGREWNSQMRVMSTRKKPMLTPTPDVMAHLQQRGALRTQIPAYKDLQQAAQARGGDMDAGRRYLEGKRYLAEKAHNKQFGEQLKAKIHSGDYQPSHIQPHQNKSPREMVGDQVINATLNSL